jgi:hypothetical protein
MFQIKVNWRGISTNQTLSKDFIKEFQDFVDWKVISQYPILSEEFIQDFQNKVKWDWMSTNQTLSEYFIREFQDFCRFEKQFLSTKFFLKSLFGTSKTKCIGEGFQLIKHFLKILLEFQDCVSWIWISAHQRLSKNITEEFQVTIHWAWSCISQKLSENLTRQFSDRINYVFSVFLFNVILLAALRYVLGRCNNIYCVGFTYRNCALSQRC